jgi:DNA-binding phage protein
MNKNINIEKVLKELPSHEDYLFEKLKNEDFQKDYLTVSLEEYIQDNNFNAFFRALERVVKVRCSVSSFCERAGIDRTNFYALKNGKKKPQLETVLKIFNELGFSLKVA